MREITRRAAAAGLLAALIALAGCVGKKEGTVSGKATYKGQAISSGTINFMDPSKGAAAQAKLGDGGAFSFDHSLAAGTYKVFFLPPIPEQLPPGQAPKKTAPFDVPTKYQDASQTTITKDVVVGKNDFTIVVPE